MIIHATDGAISFSDKYVPYMRAISVAVEDGVAGDSRSITLQWNCEVINLVLSCIRLWHKGTRDLLTSKIDIAIQIDSFLEAATFLHLPDDLYDTILKQCAIYELYNVLE